MTTSELEPLTREVQALRRTVSALIECFGGRLTREQLCQRRGCHRNTLTGLIERGTVPRPDANGKFLLSEVLEFEDYERKQVREV